MHANVMTRWMSAALLVTAVFCVSGAVAGDCETACTNQFIADKNACWDQYKQTSAQLDQREDACRQLPPDQQRACLAQVGKDRLSAFKTYLRCVADAIKRYGACLYNCSVSPSAP